MGFRKFTPINQYIPSNTLVVLYNILSEMDGVIGWAVNQDGDVTVEYDHNRINGNVVEEALAGIGLQRFQTQGKMLSL
jgi:hypothetical protein